MIDYIAIIDNKEIYANSKDFQLVAFDSTSVVICCLPELLACLLLVSIWLAGIQIFNQSSLILTAINAQP